MTEKERLEKAEVLLLEVRQLMSMGGCSCRMFWIDGEQQVHFEESCEEMDMIDKINEFMSLPSWRS